MLIYKLYHFTIKKLKIYIKKQDFIEKFNSLELSNINKKIEKFRT